MQTSLHSFLLATLAPGLSIDDIQTMTSATASPKAKAVPAKFERAMANAPAEMLGLVRLMRNAFARGRRISAEQAVHWAINNEVDIDSAVALVKGRN